MLKSITANKIQINGSWNVSMSAQVLPEPSPEHRHATKDEFIAFLRSASNHLPGRTVNGRHAIASEFTFAALVLTSEGVFNLDGQPGSTDKRPTVMAVVRKDGHPFYSVEQG